MSIDASFSPVSFPTLRAEATDDVLRARTSGRAAGYAAGLHAAQREVAELMAQNEQELVDALAEGQQRIDHAVAVLTAAAEALERRTAPVVQDVHESLAAAAVDLAEAIIGVELGDSSTSAATALRRALHTVDTALVVKVRLNPEDLDQLGQVALGETGVTFTADSTLARGDAVTEFEDGYLDARVSTALDRARTALDEVTL